MMICNRKSARAATRYINSTRQRWPRGASVWSDASVPRRTSAALAGCAPIRGSSADVPCEKGLGRIVGDGGLQLIVDDNREPGDVGRLRNLPQRSTPRN